MALIFYYLSGSPFSWKVWLALEHKQLDYELRILSVDAGDLKSAEFLALNPRGKAPVLVDEVWPICESSAIVDYIEDRYPSSGAPLWPRDAHIKALARQATIEADSFIYPNVRKLAVEVLMRKDGQPNMAVVGEAISALVSELPRFAGMTQGPYVAGIQPSVADYALYPFHAILKRVGARRPDLAIGTILPDAIHSWMMRVEALNHFAKTIPHHWGAS